MEILGIGPLEAIFIVLLALIAIGPRDLGTAARSLGRTLNRVYRSEAWQSLTQASRNLRGLPNRLAREAALEELDQVRRDLKDGPRPPTLPGSPPLAVGSDSGTAQPWPVSPQAEGAKSGGPVRSGDGSPGGGKPLPEKSRATKLPSGVVSRRKTGHSSTRPSGAGARSKKISANKRPARSGARKKAARSAKRPPRPTPRRGRPS
ncbi:MAG: Sec-independent protein translocase subunit TatA/TatB [Anaerolineales bacterium]